MFLYAVPNPEGLA